MRGISRRLQKANRFLEKLIARLVIPTSHFVISGVTTPAAHNAFVVGFAPYQTPACRIQHRALAYGLARRGISAVTLLNKSDANWPETPQPKTLSDTKTKKFRSFSESIAYLVEFVLHNPLLARGVIDSYVRLSPLEAFTGRFQVDSSFLETARANVYRAVQETEGLTGLVLADSAYMRNRSLFGAAVNRGIPVWTLNPDGQWLRVDEHQDENFFPQSPEDIERQLTSDPELASMAHAYAQKRFSGSSQSDLDSSRAFAGADELPEYLRGRKILFLHAFRDSSQLPMDTGFPQRHSLFRTYYEWTDFVLSVIARLPSEWAIKSHPSGSFYRDDGQILRYLLDKHGIAELPSVSNVSTRALLSHRVPIYTHSGHVALEAPIFGYKAHTCSTRFHDSLVLRCRSEEELTEALLLGYEEARAASVTPAQSAMAEVMLYQRFHPRFRDLSPSIAQPSRESKIAFQKSLLGQQLSLARKLLTARGVRLLKEAQAEVLDAMEAAAQRRSNEHG